MQWAQCTWPAGLAGIGLYSFGCLPGTVGQEHVSSDFFRNSLLFLCQYKYAEASELASLL